MTIVQGIRRPSARAAFVLLASLMLGRAAHAQPESTQPVSAAEVDSLKDRGNAAMKSGRPADALAAYEKVYASTKDAAMLYNMARAQQALTNYAQAVQLLTQFKREAPPDILAKVQGLDNLVSELSARIHTVHIHCAVSGAEVRLGGKILGTTPLEQSIQVNSGSADLDVRADGYLPFTRHLELQGGGDSSIEVDLQKMDKRGILVVRSSQPGAAVWIDGRRVGNVPVEVALPPGEHEVLVTRAGAKDTKTRVVVATGQRKDTTIDPAPTPSVFTRWWFWTGVAVVVAGGAATYIAVTHEKPAPTGSIPPGQVTISHF